MPTPPRSAGRCSTCRPATSASPSSHCGPSARWRTWASRPDVDVDYEYRLVRSYRISGAEGPSGCSASRPAGHAWRSPSPTWSREIRSRGLTDFSHPRYYNIEWMKLLEEAVEIVRRHGYVLSTPERAAEEGVARIGRPHAPLRLMRPCASWCSAGGASSAPRLARRRRGIARADPAHPAEADVTDAGAVAARGPGRRPRRGGERRGVPQGRALRGGPRDGPAVNAIGAIATSPGPRPTRAPGACSSAPTTSSTAKQAESATRRTTRSPR